MTYCKANSCYSSTNYSWEDYCSYHETCLARLRRTYSDFSNIEALDTFETWFNGNCGWVVTYDYSSSSSYPYYVWIVIYEPSYRSISDDISAIKYDNYSSSSYAKDKAQELKRKLQNSSGWYDTPMLEVHPKANSYESFSSLITSPYVEKKEVGSASVDNYIVYINGSGTTPSNLDRYFKPLDIVKVREAHTVAGLVSGVTFYHVGIYLGDVGSGDRICHFSRKRDGVRLTDWEGFLKDRIGELYRYHPTIPYVGLAPFTGGLSLIGAGVSAGLTGVGVVASGAGGIENTTLNNDKGSTIKLTNEMSESNGKLSERDNWLSDRIKANIEVPSKDYCRIM